MGNGGLPIVLNSALEKRDDTLIIKIEGSKKSHEIDMGKIMVKELSFGDEQH